MLRSDDDFYTPLRVEPTLLSATEGEVGNGEVVNVTMEIVSNTVKWAFITTNVGTKGYIKLSYCTPLRRRQCVEL